MGGITRRETEMPEGAMMEMFVASPDKWGEVLAGVRPRALICALGTTWKKAGKDEAAFRAVDQDLIVNTAKAAKKAGIENMVLVSSAGADAASKTLYMKFNCDSERLVSQVGFKRLDILRPGLLKGERQDDFRLVERLSVALTPLLEPLLPEKYAAFRSIAAELVAQAALNLSLRKAAGRFTHDYEAMRRAAREWRGKLA